ncbi:semaphorin-4D-like [Rhinatrema bivittatum]|uniref:semaphorin-4D-like n=1 Tax=Rhinatrema bivittatum TaxID=194408 RepID=UPI00112DA8ED|nr:semaphorin-4D-like [Rhinatrema bivittatum]
MHQDLTWLDPQNQDRSEINLKYFYEPDISNYSMLLLSEDENVLYVGAREAIYAVNALDISELQQKVYWKASEDQINECVMKGKDKQTECLNYVRVLQPLKENVLYVCGTNAFHPICDYLDLTTFELAGTNEDGTGQSPFDPKKSYTSVMVDGELYSGTSINVMGSMHTIFRHSPENNLKTHSSILWLDEPIFVFADVIRRSENDANGDDDKVYISFNENSLEYNFLNKMLIPRIARVCKGDQGGFWTLEKTWTTFLKATLVCHLPEGNYVFHVITDVFILKSPSLKEPLIYGVFTAHLNNIGMSAVCAYSLASIEEVFATGKYMQSFVTDHKEIKYVPYSGNIPEPRPGMCINSFDNERKYNSSIDLPTSHLEFVQNHPLIFDTVNPIGNKPQLLKKNAIYTQIVVDRVEALDSNTYNVMFLGTDEGFLHKAINFEKRMYIIEHVQIFSDADPVQTLLLSSNKNQRYIYASSFSEVVQIPIALCDKYTTCTGCVIIRDPYCAWSPTKLSCINILEKEDTDRDLIQNINGDDSSCSDYQPL